MNQPTNQLASQNQLPRNHPTNNQPTNPKINRQQTKKAGCNPHIWGGGSITWEEGGQSTPQLPPHSQLQGTVPKAGGGKGGGMVGSGHLYNATCTHIKEE